MLVEARRILPCYALEGAHLRPVDQGLINRTFRVDHPDRGSFALQRLNPVFGVEVNTDLEHVTEHLSRLGMTTPRLVRTTTGARDVDIAGGIWRLLTWIEGRCLDRLDHPRRARSAGRLLGRFHSALQSLASPFAHARTHVHDTECHLEGLREALETHSSHDAYSQIAPVGHAILQHADQLPPLPRDRACAVHGDPKVSNLLFDPTTDEAICMVDLDTLSRMPIVLELGDAFRSWCSTSREDERSADFDIELFEAAVSGYADGSSDLLTPAERAALVTATEAISTELAARFARDALEEKYFGWDRTRFATRSAHNLVRAQNQLGLAKAIQACRPVAEERAQRAFDRS